MFIIKIGGSVFAPKKSNNFYTDLLQKISSIIIKNSNKQIILIHGTGNFGHDFVNEFGINSETFKIYKERRKVFYKKIDKIFSGFNRLNAEDVLEKGEKIIEKSKNYVIGGDINSTNLKIISSDIIFSILSKANNKYKKIMLSDVAGVLDNKGNIIKNLSLSSIDKIKFWPKKGDVTNGMEGKLLSLNNSLIDDKNGIWIIDGKKLENFERLIITGDCNGTYIKK